MDIHRRHSAPRRPPTTRAGLLRLSLLTVACACACACGGPSGTSLTNITSDPAAGLLPPGSTVTSTRNDDLHGSISGKQRAELSRQVSSTSSCSTVSAFYRAELLRRGWTQNGGINSLENDISNVGWSKDPLRLGLAIEHAPITTTGAAPRAVLPGGCQFRVDLQGS